MFSVVDLSHSLDSTTTIYPGDPSFSCCPALTLGKDGVNVQLLSLGTHSGTHIDAPYHFYADGQTVEDIPLTRFQGPVVLVDVTDRRPKERILWADVAGQLSDLPPTVLRDALVLFRTDWARYWGMEEYLRHPFLDGEVARKLVELDVRFIGIDTLSPDETHVQEQEDMDFTVHKVLLKADIIIAENLNNLGFLAEGQWRACMAPLKITGADGSPVRAFAWRDT